MKFLIWLAEHPKIAYLFTWFGFLYSIWVAVTFNYELWGLVMVLMGWAGLVYMASVIHLPRIFSKISVRSDKTKEGKVNG